MKLLGEIAVGLLYLLRRRAPWHAYDFVGIAHAPKTAGSVGSPQLGGVGAPRGRACNRGHCWGSAQSYLHASSLGCEGDSSRSFGTVADKQSLHYATELLAAWLMAGA